jgi:hypothetical protein
MPDKPQSFSSTVLGSKLTTFANSFPHDAWMPPSATTTFTSDKDYFAFYARAFGAMEQCCDDPTSTGCTK